MESIINVLFLSFGMVIGSFLNVCIVRLPKEDEKERSIVTPGSHCVHCKKPIAWYDNIPVLSYLLLNGKCRFCHKEISFRYALVEMLTGLLFLVFYKYFGLSAVLWPYLVLLCGLIIATFIDIEHRIIPDEITLGGIVVGFILSLFIPELHGSNVHYVGAVRSFFGIIVGGGSIYLMGLLGDFIFKKESMGGGDVKLMAMVGAFLGWKLAVLAFFIAPFFGAIVGIVIKIRTKESLIPYGPFLALGSLIALFFSNQIIYWIFNMYGV